MRRRKRETESFCVREREGNEYAPRSQRQENMIFQRASAVVTSTTDAVDCGSSTKGVVSEQQPSQDILNSILEKTVQVAELSTENDELKSQIKNLEHTNGQLVQNQKQNATILFKLNHLIKLLTGNDVDDGDNNDNTSKDPMATFKEIKGCLRVHFDDVQQLTDKCKSYETRIKELEQELTEKEEAKEATMKLLVDEKRKFEKTTKAFEEEKRKSAAAKESSSSAHHSNRPQSPLRPPEPPLLTSPSPSRRRYYTTASPARPSNRTSTTTSGASPRVSSASPLRSRSGSGSGDNSGGVGRPSGTATRREILLRNSLEDPPTGSNKKDDGTSNNASHEQGEQQQSSRPSRRDRVPYTSDRSRSRSNSLSRRAQRIRSSSLNCRKARGVGRTGVATGGRSKSGTTNNNTSAAALSQSLSDISFNSSLDSINIKPLRSPKNYSDKAVASFNNSSSSRLSVPPLHPLPAAVPNATAMMSPNASRGVQRVHSASSPRSSSRQRRSQPSTAADSTPNASSNRRSLSRTRQVRKTNSDSDIRPLSNHSQRNSSYRMEDLIHASVTKADSNLHDNPGLELEEDCGKVYITNIYGLFRAWTNGIQVGQQVIKLQNKFVDVYPGGIEEIRNVLLRDKEISIQVLKLK